MTTEEPTPTTPPSTLAIPELGLVALVGASGCGKSTFARAHFKPTEVLSSDACRAWVADDELDQSATGDAFDVLHYIAAKRLERGKLVVIDATNVQPAARKALVNLAKSQNVLATAIIFNVPERVCQERNASRTDRVVPQHAIGRQCQDLRRHGPRDIAREGFRYTFTLTPDDMDRVRIERTKLWSDKRKEHGPFDVIGDVHGCIRELRTLLARLGYAPDEARGGAYAHPQGRKAFFVGDLADRGPGTVETLDLARAMVDSGTAFAVPGNHDEKLAKWLAGKRVSLANGLEETVAEIDAIPIEQLRDWKTATHKFLDGLVSHAVLDDGNLVVAHAGMAEKLQGRSSGAVRSFALYGDVSGEMDEMGLPVRHDWAADYRGRAAVVYGHTPQAEARWVNNTINIDTGCVFGGSLTALRWPERELISVPAEATYAEPSRPFLSGPSVGRVGDAAKFVSQYDLMLGDVYESAPVAGGVSGGGLQGAFGGKRRVETKLAGSVSLAPENAAAALELISRFGVDPRWLVTLPPTMSPCATEPAGEPYLEHPRGAFGYYAQQGVGEIVCEEKHMGSRALIVICRDEAAARRRFGVSETMGIGECYTRTGRRFFDGALRAEFLARVKAALDAAGFWDEQATDWAVIDSEILPWNAKAQGLLRQQYAPVGAAANASLAAARRAIEAAGERGVAVDVADIVLRADAVRKYVEAYQAYCWPVDGLSGLQAAPFHLLATEGAVHTDKDHLWHLAALAKLAEADPALFRATDHLVVNLEDETSRQAGIDWWLRKTEGQAEGMVVKPREFIARSDKRGILQPAIKCRGREYLRIIYGPEYTLPRNLELLRARGLQRKRGLALREFALGIEGLERFVQGEPLHRVHECAFGVLALESEPVDPRL